MAAAQGIRAGRAFVELGVSDRLTAGLKKAQTQLRAFGEGVRSVGQKLVTASAGALAPLAVSGTLFAGFEQRMARVQALTGATGRQFDALRKEAMRLGAETVYTARQAADAMAFFALAGYDVEKILKSTGPTLNLAAAGLLDISEAADISVKIMAGMGIEADHVGYAVDVLTKAMTTANTDLRQLGDAMKYVGPIAKSAGIRFEEIVAAIQMLSNAGIQAEMAGTTLRGALLSLTDPSKEAADELQRLGVRVADAQGNTRPLADIIEDMSRALEGMGTAERLAVIGKIFDARQAAGFAELLSQGAGRLREFTAALRDAGGTATRIAGVQLNTLQGDVVILKSVLEGLAITTGEAFQAPLRVVVQALSKVVAAVKDWVAANRDLVVMAVAAALGIGALGTTLVTVGLSAKAAAFVLGGLGSILAGVKVIFVAATAAIGAMLSPIGLVVTAVAGLGVAAVVYSGAAGDALIWLGEQFGRLRDMVSRVTGGITDALAAGEPALAAKILWLALKLAWQQGVDALNRAWLEAKRFFIGTAQAMWFGALAAAQQVFHALEVAWIESTAFLSKTWTNFTSDLREAWGLIHNWLTKRWLDLMNLFGQLTDQQAEAAKQMADQDFADTAAGIEQRRGGALAEREQRRQSEREQSAAVNEATLTEIGRQFEEAQRALDADTDAKIAETKHQLAEARKALDEALAEAKRKREDAETEKAPPGRPKLSGDLKDQLEGIADVLAGKISVTGTFNPLAAAGLGGGDAVERTARATEETAKHTKRLAETAGRLTFA